MADARGAAVEGLEMAAEIYTVEWYDGARDGFYVELTEEGAARVLAMLKSLKRRDVIDKIIRVESIKKPWLLTEKQFVRELEGRDWITPRDWMPKK